MNGRFVGMKNTENRRLPVVSHTNTLCILVRGWVNSNDWILSLPGERGRKGGDIPPDFKSYVESVLPGATVKVLELEMSAFSVQTPEQLAMEALSQVDAYFAGGRFRRVMFVAFSSGAPIIRYAIMRAFGVRLDGSIDLTERRDWAKPEVEMRVIYLAGILRGWKYSTAMPTKLRLLKMPLGALVHMICYLRHRKRPFIFQVAGRTPFIISGQLMQLALRDEHGGASLPFEQVSFLGTRDEFISPSDCIEINGTDRSIFVEVPGTNHLGMLDVCAPPSANQTEQITCRARAEKIRRALTDTFTNMASDDSFAINEDDINDYFDELDRPHDIRAAKIHRKIKRAVIVLHGIRDNGFWTKRVARKLKQSGEVRPLLRAPSPSYGFFSLRDFISKSRREQQARWLLEQFVEIREAYPSAKISFVGHSNGTYLAKSALKQCPAVKFERIVFAGSVVRTDFDWSEVAPQIEGGVLNLMGRSDWVVALLPGAMQKAGLNHLDVGGAGFYGFDPSVDCKVPVLSIQIDGGHGAGISEASWDRIVDFVQGKDVASDGDIDTGLFGKLAPYLSTLALLIALLVAFFSIWCIFSIGGFYSGIGLALLLSFALWLLKKF